MFEILHRFGAKFAPLKKKGLEVHGLLMIDPKRKAHAIDISRPFMFDCRALPKKYEGLTVKARISGQLPEEFQVDRSREDWHKFDYIWAPERFEKFVDRSLDLIRENLQLPEMTREEALDALCFGNFEDHVTRCQQLIKDGKIPAYKDKKELAEAV